MRSEFISKFDVEFISCPTSSRYMFSISYMTAKYLFIVSASVLSNIG